MLPMTTRHRDLGELPDILARLGARKVLLVTGPSARFVDRIESLIAPMPIELLAGARRHVPEDALAAARVRLDASGADTLVALGGGAAIGLCKALRREHAVGFVAIPTTYSGSELTDIYGITPAGSKRTGRDPRVRADAVIHDVALTLEMPRALTVTSLMNALAHPIATLAAGLLPPEREHEGLLAIERIFSALEVLVQSPDSRRAREGAIEGAALAAQTLEIGTPGVHHKLAHRLGGRFDLEHGALHGLLLPHTLHRLRRLPPNSEVPTEGGAPDLVAAIESRLRVPDLEGALFDLLVRAGVPTSLLAMNVTRAALEALLAEAPELPRDVALAAFHGRRPSREVSREDWGLREPVSVRGDPTRARRVVIALHGRGATADSIVRRVLEIVGDDPEVAVVAPHAPGNAWYSNRFTAPRATLEPELEIARSEVAQTLGRVLSEVQPGRVALFGFSQGACLALDVFAHLNRPFAALVALSGGAIGEDAELAAPSAAVAATPVLLGGSAGDPWIPWERVDATANLLRAVGCAVHLERVPGSTHALHLRHRLLARPLLTGRPEAEPPGGFGNTLSFEGLPGALPRDRNTPRLAPYGLYPEQLNLTGFTAPRAHNRRAWLYRVRPAARHGPLAPLTHPTLTTDFRERPPEANLVGLSPLPIPESPTDFIDGLHTLGGVGTPALRRGYAVHLYVANRNMEDRAFHDADGDLLIIPQAGGLTLFTELGALDARPGDIALIPRGVRFSVQLMDDHARGWVAEAFGPGFTLPERGPVGANGLADARHFQGPRAFFEDRLAPGHRMTMKLGGALYETTQETSPFDVVAWHGNAVPMTYPLAMFSPIGMARVDHIDPSAHTVLSAPLDEAGADALDLVAFVPRWDPSEGTFRPPYFHRNVTTELNGVIAERAPAGSPFQPGLTFLTPSLVPHGVVASGVERAFSLDPEVADRPSRSSDDSLWFQLESALPMSLTRWATGAPSRMRDWHLVWGQYRSHFRTGT